MFTFFYLLFHILHTLTKGMGTCWNYKFWFTRLLSIVWILARRRLYSSEDFTCYYDNLETLNFIFSPGWYSLNRFSSWINDFFNLYKGGARTDPSWLQLCWGLVGGNIVLLSKFGIIKKLSINNQTKKYIPSVLISSQKKWVINKTLNFSIFEFIYEFIEFHYILIIDFTFWQLFCHLCLL